MNHLPHRLPHLTLSAALAASLLLAGVSTNSAVAAEAKDLSQGAPLQVEGTEVSKAGEVQVQFGLQSDRTREDENEFEFQPEIQVGLTDKLQLEIALPVLAGAGDRTGSGDAAVRLLGKLWEEEGARPSVALAGQVQLPTGYESEGVETELKFIATKSFGPEDRQHRLHFNASWLHHFDAQPGEREDLYKVVVGYDRQLSKETLVLADLFIEQQREYGETYKMVEVGVRRSINEDAVFGVGVGTGLDSDSPKVRVTASLEISF